MFAGLAEGHNEYCLLDNEGCTSSQWWGCWGGEEFSAQPLNPGTALLAKQAATFHQILAQSQLTTSSCMLQMVSRPTHLTDSPDATGKRCTSPPGTASRALSLAH